MKSPTSDSLPQSFCAGTSVAIRFPCDIGNMSFYADYMSAPLSSAIDSLPPIVGTHGSCVRR